MLGTFYKGEIGRRVTFPTGMDWTGYDTNRQIKIIRPDGTSITKAGADVIVDDVATGVVSFLTVESDHTLLGSYAIQAKLTTSSATLLFSRIDVYDVEDTA